MAYRIKKKSKKKRSFLVVKEGASTKRPQPPEIVTGDAEEHTNDSQEDEPDNSN